MLVNILGINNDARCDEMVLHGWHDGVPAGRTPGRKGNAMSAGPVLDGP